MSSANLTRREIVKVAAAAGAAFATKSALAAVAPAPANERAFYYVDGYHGGIDGHMPPASLRNVLDGLDKFPEWKVSFEIEPYSWAAFAKSDAPSIERLKHLLADGTPSGRVEIVSGAYGQAYMWNASGESNIRQLQFGLAELRASLPGVVIDTYAVQEPCWTSCLPQLLKSMGYQRAVLKNSTCWGGYHAPALNADLVHWVGPDGSRIVAVPRYALEDLVPPATMLGSQPNTAFIDRCLAAGIQHPAGTTLQDMGWPGRPWRFGMEAAAFRALKHVTWREYTEKIALPAAKEWKASQEDLRVALPWGGSVLQRIAQLVRVSENQLVQAEKLASMAFVGNQIAFPSEQFAQAWKHLLWSQHHDVWIVSYNRYHDGTWATSVDAKRELIDATCKQVMSDAIVSMAPHKDADSKEIRVFNTTGFRRRDLASLEIPAGEHLRVLDSQGREVPSQIISRHDDSAALLFAADVPAMGYSTYQLASGSAAQPKDAPAKAQTQPDGTVRLETDLYTLLIDPAKGGRITSLFAKELNREFVDTASNRSFHEFRGYFPSVGKWLTSIDAPAQIQIVENGPVHVKAKITGKIGDWPFTTHLTFESARRRIDFQTEFDFPIDTPTARNRIRVGEPWEADRSATRSNQQPFYDASFKLQALFPAKLTKPTLDKNAPFDVCRSTLTDTRFNSWETIKHNVVSNWIDLLDENGQAGLAIMTDHVTSYCLTPDEPLGIVLCYAGAGIWHDYRLGRKPNISYSIVPHAGDWAAAQLWRELARWSEPLIARTSAPLDKGAEWSLLDVSQPGIEVTAVQIEGGELLVRLFNAEGDATPRAVSLDRRIKRVRMVELDGRLIEELPVQHSPDGKFIITIKMPRFAVWTLRCSLA